MACFDRCKVKLSKISRAIFFALLVAQPILLSKFIVNHNSNDGFYGLAAMFVIPLGIWIYHLGHNTLKQHLSIVWFSYSCVLVIMMGVIFGQAVIEDNKLREQEIATCLCNTTNTATKSHSFFDSKFLKITLCFTPGIMLLLLTSVTDETETLKQLYFISVMDLFDGVEMIEVLHEDICDKIPKGWEIAVLVAALLFFLSSFLEVHTIKFKKPKNAENPDGGKSNNSDEDKSNNPDEEQSENSDEELEIPDEERSTQQDGEKVEKQDDEVTFRKKTAIVNTIFEIVLNLAFLIIRAVLWFHYDFDSAVFLAKNFIALFIFVVDILKAVGCIIPDDDGSGKKESIPLQPGVDNLCTSVRE